MSNPVGRPITTDWEDLRQKFYAYIAEHTVPIASEFAYQNGLWKQRLYDQPELAEPLKLCLTKKEAALERGTLEGKLTPAMAIFSLKQMGWTDKQEHLGAGGGPIVISATDASL